ncbi:hypothetical protein QBC46DRAFT_420498 [Diplogelasinospora grovesii]|uniref:Uncharacterized protein n=1 Tax=Diplogelasinospora grovesii TaxID=303347 RepID=A0AAN6N236_9PEZI|nr:hypothetical protein QBC46DRAFT_420498 [Diplogelasinospora grovesii]
MSRRFFQNTARGAVGFALAATTVYASTVFADHLHKKFFSRIPIRAVNPISVGEYKRNKSDERGQIVKTNSKTNSNGRVPDHARHLAVSRDVLEHLLRDMCAGRVKSTGPLRPEVFSAFVPKRDTPVDGVQCNGTVIQVLDMDIRGCRCRAEKGSSQAGIAGSVIGKVLMPEKDGICCDKEIVKVEIVEDTKSDKICFEALACFQLWASLLNGAGLIGEGGTAVLVSRDTLRVFDYRDGKLIARRAPPPDEVARFMVTSL